MAIKPYNNVDIVTVLITCLFSGVIFGFVLGKMFLECYKSDNISIAVSEDKNGCIVKSIDKLDVPMFSKDKLTSVFTADSCVLVGDNKYKFTKPILTDLYPGTKKVKSVLTSDFAVMTFSGRSMSKVKDALWYGHLKRKTY